MGQLIKARIYAADDGENYSFYVQFNPASISVQENVGHSASRNVTQEQADGTPGALKPQNPPFEGSSEAQLSTKLFYNTYQSATSYTDVRDPIKQFYYFFTPGKESVSNKKIGFAWGSLLLVGILTSMQVSYSMFASDGTPVRAEVSITISGNYSDRQSKEVGKDSFVEQLELGGDLMSRLRGYYDPEGWRELLPKGDVPLPEHYAAMFP